MLLTRLVLTYCTFVPRQSDALPPITLTLTLSAQVRPTALSLSLSLTLSPNQSDPLPEA